MDEPWVIINPATDAYPVPDTRVPDKLALNLPFHTGHYSKPASGARSR